MKNLVLMGGISMLALALAACGDAGGGGDGGSGTTSTSTSASTGTSTSTSTTSTTTGTTTSSTSSGEGGSGGDGGGTTSGGGEGGAGGTGGAGGGEPASVVEVDCAGATIAETIVNVGAQAFDPATVTIAVGEVIQFTPNGPHDMTSDDGAFATPNGQEACLRFDAAGDFPFHCSFHAAMTGTVTVE